jgi:DNA-binding transcriptional MerR regulator
MDWALIEPFSSPMSEEEKGQYTIDDLAAVSRVPSRTIRFYQSKGALQKPEIQGRVAFYGPAHVERLKLIAQLQDRGLRIDAIRDLTSRIDKGEVDVGEWLGLEAKLKQSWANDQPRTVTENELYELAGVQRPGLIGELSRAKLIQKRGDVYLIKSPALLRVAMQLETAGLDLETATGGAEIMRKHLARAADELASYFFKHAREGFGRKATAEEFAVLVEALRPTGMEAVRVVFGQEMERVLRDLVASGKTTSLPAKVKKRV